MYLLSNEVTLEWVILKTVTPPALGELDLVYVTPTGEVNYVDAPLLAGNYTPPTATTNGLITALFTPELEGLWRIRLVIGTAEDYEIKSKMDMYVFDNTTTTPAFVEEPDSTTIPFEFTSWENDFSYGRNAIVKIDNNFYLSTDVNNLGNNPATSPGNNSYWTFIQFVSMYNQQTAYSIGRLVVTLNGKLWNSVSNGNTANNPLTDTGSNWEPAVVIPVSSRKTTTDLIANTEVYDLDIIIESSGYTFSEDTGAAPWIQNGVTGRPVNQSPKQLDDLLANDGLGNQWKMLHKGVVSISQLGGLIADFNNGDVISAFNSSSAYALDLEGLTWFARDIDSDSSIGKSKLQKSFINGTLVVVNSFNNDVNLQTIQTFPQDEIAVSGKKSQILTWKDKNVLWLGTSIPHQGVGSDGYPELLSSTLDFTVDNWAWSGSHAFYDLTGDPFSAGTVRSLSMTEADRLAGLALYGSSSAYDDSFNIVTLASKMTVEHRIKDQFIANAYDVVVLDHNHNDRKSVQRYTPNNKIITGITKSTTTFVVVNSVSGLSIGDGVYLEVSGIANLQYAAARINQISGNTVSLLIDSSGYTGSFSSGTLHWVDRNTLEGSFDFLISYIKNMGIVYGNSDVKIVLCNSPSYFTNNANRDYSIWNSGKTIKTISDKWSLSYFDVAASLDLIYEQHLIYFPDAVHPSTLETRKALAAYWAEWMSGGKQTVTNAADSLAKNKLVLDAHQELALFSKYDDAYAYRANLFSDDTPIISEDFSGGIGTWTVTSTPPVIEAAPWGVGSAAKIVVTTAAPQPFITKTSALAFDPILEFDLYFPTISLATGVSNQLTVFSLITADTTAYNVAIIQSAGGTARLSVSRSDTDVVSVNIPTYLIEAATKYTIKVDIIKGDTTSSDGYIRITVNDVKLYASSFPNGGVAAITATRLGAVFNNMGSSFNFFISNIVAASKTRRPSTSYSGLGSAATEDVTTSDTDTTAGRLTKVGDFGPGSLSGISLGATSLNNALTSGSYYYINNTTETPEAGTFGTVHVEKLGINAGSQFAISTSSGKSFFRAFTTSGFSDWQEIFHSGNSVNPLDYGLGAEAARNAEITDCNTVIVAGFYTVSPSATNRPPGTPANNTKLVVLGGSYSSRTTQIFSNDAVSVSSIWVRNYNAAWSNWQEIFHTGNSVNPLDFGLKEAVTLSANDDLDTLVETKLWFNPTASYTPNNNYPIASAGSVFVIARASSNVTQEFVKYADGVLSRKWFRSKGTAGWSDWQEIYHSGNSVNPLDYGLGIEGGTASNSFVINSFDASKTSGICFVNGNVPDGPNGMSYERGTLLVMTETNSGSSFYGSQTFIERANNKMWFRTCEADVFGSWNEMFHSGNLVNPIDHGIGAISPTLTNANNPILGSLQTSGQLTHANAILANFPDVGFSSSSPVWFNVFTYGGASTRLTQEASQIFGSSKSRKFIRNKQDNVWDEWVEIFTSGNINFDVFIVNNARNLKAHGVALNGITIRFDLPLNSKVLPANVSNVGSFKIVKNSTGATLATGLSATMASESTHKNLCADFIVPSGAIAGDSYRAVAESNSSITVTY